MVQPKYNPKEALERAKLLMKYDTSKTLTENTEPLKTINEEAEILNEIAPAVIIGIIAAAAALTGGGAYANASNWFRGSSTAEAKIREISKICDSKGSIQAPYKFLEGTLFTQSLGPAVSARIAADVRDAANYAWGTDEELMLNALKQIVAGGTFGDYCEARRQFSQTKPSEFEETIIDELDGNDQSKVVGILGQIMAKAQKFIKTKTDTWQQPDTWLDTFSCLTDVKALPPRWMNDIQADENGRATIPILVKMPNGVQTYRLNQEGKVYYSVDGKFTGLKVSCVNDKVSITGTLIKESKEKKNRLKEQITPPQPQNNNNGGGGGKPKPKPKPEPTFVNCVGLYRPGCKSKAIEQVQACLNLKVDGKYGKELDDYLEYQFGLRSFTDKQIEMICDKTGYYDYKKNAVEKSETDKVEGSEPSTGYEDYKPNQQTPATPAAPAQPNSPTPDKKAFYPNPDEENL